MVDYSKWANMPSSPSSSDSDSPRNTQATTTGNTRSRQQPHLRDIADNSIPRGGSRCRGAVVFLHGSGDTGAGVRQWLEAASGGEFERVLGSELGLKVVFPTAPKRPYTLAEGMPSTVWFDRERLSPRSPQDREGVLRSLRQVEDKVRKIEEEEGVPRSAIFVGGFSMGGCLALELLGSELFAGRLAGVFSHASFLSDDSAVFETAQVARTPVYSSHGSADGLVQASWGRSTAERLRGIAGLDELQFTEHDGLDHELGEKQIMGLLEWITVITRRLDFGQSTESNESVGDGVPGSPGRDASEESQCSVAYELAELGGCMCCASFEVPPGSEDLLSGANVCARGAFFKLEKMATPGKVSTSFMSPKPDLTAQAIARRIEKRLVDPRPPGIDEACCLS